MRCSFPLQLEGWKLSACGITRQLIRLCLPFIMSLTRILVVLQQSCLSVGLQMLWNTEMQILWLERGSELPLFWLEKFTFSTVVLRLSVRLKFMLKHTYNFNLNFRCCCGRSRTGVADAGLMSIITTRVGAVSLALMWGWLEHKWI
jgi:hypothetical protein